MAAAAAKIAPSMLSSDFANLAAEAERMVRLGADWLHMDVMVRSIPSHLSPSILFLPLPNQSSGEAGSLARYRPSIRRIVVCLAHRGRIEPPTAAVA
jgi:hypothetical protein